MIPTALLRARGHHTLGFLDPAMSLSPSASVCDRFFAIHVLAGGHGVECHGDVPMVGRADHHAVDITAIEHFAIIARGLGLRPHLLHRFQAAGFVDIACRDNFVARESLEQLRQIHAPSAGADEADADTIICA